MSADTFPESHFARLNDKQRAALGEIAIGEDRGHHPQTLKSLMAKGLIGQYEESIWTELGLLRIKRYFVPLPVHARWCAWCSETCDEEE